MYGKVILALAFFAFVAVQLAASLKCYTCGSTSSCKHPEIVTCDAEAANETRTVMYIYEEVVKALNIKDFECFTASSSYLNHTPWVVSGCIMKGAISCSQLKDQNHNTTKCNICQKDLCNSAGGVSFSILTVISLAVLAKVFVM